MTEDLFFPATWQHKQRLPSLRVDNSTSGKITHYCFGANSTGTCFIQKIYGPSSPLLQGKHLPFSPSALRLKIVHLFVILSGHPQTNWTRKVSERGLLKISVNETDTATSGLRWIFHMHSEFSRPAMCSNAT